MNSIINATMPQPASLQEPLQANTKLPAAKELETREVFQDAIAGTFYKQMLKSLRSTQDKPAYFHGGQAENIFQGQLDQHIAEDMARTDGAEFSDSLYEVFMQKLTAQQQS